MQSGEENSSNPVGHLVLTLTLDSGTKDSPNK